MRIAVSDEITAMFTDITRGVGQQRLVSETKR